MMADVLTYENQGFTSPVPLEFNPEGVAHITFDKNLLFLVGSAIPPEDRGLKVLALLLYYATLDPKTITQKVQAYFNTCGSRRGGKA